MRYFLPPILGYDFDGDGRSELGIPEIWEGTKLSFYHGRSYRRVGSLGLGYSTYPEIGASIRGRIKNGDPDNDGRPEYLMSVVGWDGKSKLVLLEGTAGPIWEERAGQEEWSLYVPGKGARGYMAYPSTDVDGDGRPEIVAVINAAQPRGGEALLYSSDGPDSYVRVWESEEIPAFLRFHPLPADLNDDGCRELLLSYSDSDAPYPVKLLLYSFDPLKNTLVLKRIFENTNGFFAIDEREVFVSVIDVDGDSAGELLFREKDSQGNWGITAYSGREPYAEIWSLFEPGYDLEILIDQGGCDFDGDGVRELTIGAQSDSDSLKRVEVLDSRSLSLLWMEYLEAGTSVFPYFDFDGDGLSDLCIQSEGKPSPYGPHGYEKISIYRWDGTTFRVIYEIDGGPDHRFEFLGSDLCDLDGDGSDELAVVHYYHHGRDYTTTLEVWDSATGATEWSTILEEDWGYVGAVRSLCYRGLDNPEGSTDLDGDGFPEIIVQGFTGVGMSYVRVYEFQKSTIETLKEGPCQPLQPFKGAIDLLMTAPGAPSLLYGREPDGGFLRSTDGGVSWETVVGSDSSSHIDALYAVDPNLVYSVEDKGFFRSSDGGRTWEKLSSSITFDANILLSDTSDRSILYVGGNGFFRSLDGGSSWEWSRVGEESLPVLSLAIDSQNRSVIYAGTSYGLFKSRDGGSTWEKLSNPEIGILPIYTICVRSDDPDVLYIMAGDKLFKAEDGGITWVKIGGELSRELISAFGIDPQDHSTLYAGTWGNGVFKSGDGGLTWKEINAGLEEKRIRSLIVDPSDHLVIYASTWNQIFRSTDGGLLWDLCSGGEAQMDVRFLLPFRERLYAGIFGQGVFTNPEGSPYWHERNEGLIDLGVRALAVIDGYVYLGTSQGVFREDKEYWSSPDRRWMNIGLSGSAVNALDHSFDPSGGDRVLYAGLDSKPWGIFRRRRRYGTWSNWKRSIAGLSLTTVHVLRVDPQRYRVIYAGLETGLFRTSDEGESWEKIHSPLIDDVPVVSISIDPIDSKIVYIGTLGGGILKSIDSGDSWITCHKRLSARNVYSISIDKYDPWFIYIGTEEGIFRSKDGGESWERLLEGKLDTSVLVVSTVPWSPNPSVVYVGTGDGVFRLTFEKDLPEDHGPPVLPPKSPYLFQNYPNPFGSSAVISFIVPGNSLEEETDVELVVYNILGQKVRTLVADIRKPGHYSVIWDGRDDRGHGVSSGVYLYRLRAGSYVKARKMVLVH